MSKLELNLYTFLDIGTPPQKVASKLVSKEYCTYFSDNFCNIKSSNYKNSESESFKKLSVSGIIYENLKNGYFAEDYITLNDSTNTEKKIKLYNFLYFNNSTSKQGTNTCGIIGFDYEQKSYSYHDCVNFITSTRRSNDSLKKEVWSIFYNKKSKYEDEKNKNMFSNNNIDYEYYGFFLLNSYPHEYNDISFNSSNFIEIYSEGYMDPINKLSFSLRFSSVSFLSPNGKNMSLTSPIYSLSGPLSFDSELIQTSIEFLDMYITLYFKDLISKSICVSEMFKRRYRVIFCEKQIGFYERFEDVKFYSDKLRYKFEIEKKDLFVENQGKLMFIFYNDRYNTKQWIFGDIFLRKYFFVFNPEAKMIGFYPDSPNGEKEIINEKENFKYNILSIFFICIAFTFIGFYFGRKFIRKNKIRVNELIDDNDYVYKPKKDINLQEI